MSVHASQEWKAVESTDFSGEDRKLNVTGQVQVGASNQKPVLSEAHPQGINPKILILELSTIEESDVGTQALTWKDAFFEKPVEENAYDQVDIKDHSIIDVEKQIF